MSSTRRHFLGMLAGAPLAAAVASEVAARPEADGLPTLHTAEGRQALMKALTPKELTPKELADLRTKQVRGEMTVNQVRALEGLPPLEEGDVVLDPDWMRRKKDIVRSRSGLTPEQIAQFKKLWAEQQASITPAWKTAKV